VKGVKEFGAALPKPFVAIPAPLPYLINPDKANSGAKIRFIFLIFIIPLNIYMLLTIPPS
jgi:hypothetical protein